MVRLMNLCLALLALVAWTGSALAASPPSAPQENMDVSQRMQQAMERTHDQHMRTPLTGNVDEDFARLMASHDQGSIAVINDYLANGRDPQLKELARRMKQQNVDSLAMLQQHTGNMGAMNRPPMDTYQQGRGGVRENEAYEDTRRLPAPR